MVAFSAFGGPVPDDAIYARTNGAGLEALCTNPAALAGGPAPLTTVYPTEPFAPGTIATLSSASRDRPLPEVRTPWLEYGGAYRGRCDAGDGANALRISPAPGAAQLNAVPDATWGLHVEEFNLVLGDLTALVRKQARRYVRTR